MTNETLTLRRMLQRIIIDCVADEIRIRNRDDGYDQSGRRVADEVFRRLNEARIEVTSR